MNHELSESLSRAMLALYPGVTKRESGDEVETVR